MDEKRVRVRYAPSPTGHLHIGNARTALFDYLFAKHYNGDFIVRIEDTDIERNVEGGEESQMYYLNWLGITSDESPLKPNPKYAPYRQTERLDIYQRYINILLEKGYAYKCFCSEEEIQEDYQHQLEEGIAATRYNRKCLHLSKEQVAQYEKEGRPYSIRIRVPDDETYEFNDMIRGNVKFESKDIGDWVAIKSNGIPTYNFAVVIDDHLMEISHVFRGEEHLSNTPKQMMLYRMLGWEIPTFGHFTIIVNENHKKLSKRDNSIMQFMSQYKDAGYLSEAMFNFLALLGWSPATDKEIFTKEELIKEFDESRLSKSPTMFDKNKLTWINNRYIKAMSEEDFVKLTKPFLEKAYDLSNKSEEWINHVIHIFHDQLSYGQEIVELASVFFNKPELNDEEAIAIMNTEGVSNTIKIFAEEIKALDTLTPENIKACLKTTQTKALVKGKMLYMPLRIALTSSMHGPDFSDILMILGKDEVLHRLGY